METAIDIGRMFKAIKHGIQVMSGKDPRVEVNKVIWRSGSSKKSKKTGKHKAGK